MQKFVVDVAMRFFIICILALISGLPKVYAEIKTYEGVGESIMSDRETAAIAKDGAKLLAIRNAQEQAGFAIKSHSIMKNNNQLENDEIAVFTAGIAKMNGDVKYEAIPLNDSLGTIMYRATVILTIDTDELDARLNQWLNLNEQYRSAVTAQNNELIKAVDDIKVKNDEVKNLIAAKTPQDNSKIQEELKALDKATLYAQKISEGNELFKAGNKDAAQKLYQEAIELYPNDATIAYEKMGDTYRLAENYSMAIESYTKVIQMDSNYSMPYYKRGVVYYILKDYDKAVADLEVALQHSPNSEFLKTLIYRAKFRLKPDDKIPFDANNPRLYCETLMDRGLNYLKLSNSVWRALKDTAQNIEINDESKSIVILAINDFSDALDKVPYQLRSYIGYELSMYRAESYRVIGDFAKAAEDYKTAILKIEDAKRNDKFKIASLFGFPYNVDWMRKKDAIKALSYRMTQAKMNY